MNLDDYRGRLLARAFHDELEKLAGPLTAAQTKVPPTAAQTKVPLTAAQTKVPGQSGNTSIGKGGLGIPSAGKPSGAPLTAAGSFSPKPIKIP